ncbi:MAG: RlmE family RNA methyltransferase [Desulfatitalea sp.]|nr:RlmE family RNA methyltransferase [Desulfatitalea sp.]NNK01698.1 RlmE family RNA methyltransferase [Desulfatitalea sp.]
MKRKKGGKASQWADHYTRRAQKENYPARSVYKLAEIQKKHRVIEKGDRVLDLGCAPGAWLKYAAEQTGAGGSVLGLDLMPVKAHLPANATAMRGDIHEMVQDPSAAFGGGFQVVLSDMAPATTGHKFSDGVRSYELCRASLAVADELLAPNGHFVCKIFQSEDFKAFCDQVKVRFERMQIFKPQSSRKASREIFVIGLGKK